jgi:hypothetical protein
MVVISSQRYRNDEIIEEKIEELKANEVTIVTIPVVDACISDEDGEDLYIIVDKHHTLEAAKELGLEIEFCEIPDEQSHYEDIENKNGEAILSTYYNDSEYYYIHHNTTEKINTLVW